MDEGLEYAECSDLLGVIAAQREQLGALRAELATAQGQVATLVARLADPEHRNPPAWPKHPQATLWPSELITISPLFALKGNSFRAFYRWLARDHTESFGALPKRHPPLARPPHPPRCAPRLPVPHRLPLMVKIPRAVIEGLECFTNTLAYAA